MNRRARCAICFVGCPVACVVSALVTALVRLSAHSSALVFKVISALLFEPLSNHIAALP